MGVGSLLSLSRALGGSLCEMEGPLSFRSFPPFLHAALRLFHRVCVLPSPDDTARKDDQFKSNLSRCSLVLSHSMFIYARLLIDSLMHGLVREHGRAEARG